MMGKYGQPIDRESARERLARALEEGARAAEAERQAAEADRQAREAAEQEAAADRAAERSRPAAGRTRQPKPEPGLVEGVLGSSVFREFTRTAGREIVRSIFGTGRRRR
jgi:hypothetical protein